MLAPGMCVPSVSTAASSRHASGQAKGMTTIMEEAVRRGWGSVPPPKAVRYEFIENSREPEGRPGRPPSICRDLGEQGRNRPDALQPRRAEPAPSPVLSPGT